ncbi:MAG: LytR family transcriptional regulator [Ignavibacteriae bacterium]|nr:MAG: LytR family transcriptional regulator [Ignavibacteriota bacterium]
MSLPKRRAVWPWVAIGLASVVVLTLLGFFIWRMIHPPVEPYVESDGPRTVIQLEVVNASGVNGAGRTAMNYLRERGFDVVELSTETEKRQRSMVVDRLGDRISALKVASVVGIADTMVVSEIDSMRFVRASLVIGADLMGLEPFQE